jgi:pilus assembly protein CpaE
VSLDAYRFLVLLDDHVTDAAIRQALPTGAQVYVTSLRDATSRGRGLLEEAAPDIVLVGCAAHSTAALQALSQISLERPDTPIIVLYEGNPNGFMDPAFKAGAEDLIVLPQPTEQLRFQLQKAIARRRGPAGGQPSPMITILGPKGGTGKTLTSCNLAVAFARAGRRAVIVDIDLQFGDVGLALGLRPEKTIFDLATAGGTLDAEKVDSYITQHESGARVLLAPTRPDQAVAIKTSFLRQLFEILRTRYDFVIVDTPPAFSPEVITAIDMASDLCVVGMLDALSLKDTKIGFETLQQMGYPPAEVTLVLNRADSDVGISTDDVRRLLGKTPEVLVPSDRSIPRALTSGMTITEADPRSGAARAFGDLAEIYLGIDSPAAIGFAHELPSRRRRALLRRGN